jgi:hypothetical protein
MFVSIWNYELDFLPQVDCVQLDGLMENPASEDLPFAARDNNSHHFWSPVS